MIKNIVFDYGKVLLDWDPHYMYDSYFADQAKADYFINDVLSPEWYDEGDIGTPMKEVVAKWSARYPEFADAFEYYIKEFPKTTKRQVPGMYELMSELKEKGYHLYGLSNWNRETFDTVRSKYPIFNLLEGEVVSGDVHMLKPHADIYNCLLERFKLKPEETVFTDDRQVNIDGAKAVGIHGILFKDAEQLKKDFFHESFD